MASRDDRVCLECDFGLPRIDSHCLCENCPSAVCTEESRCLGCADLSKVEHTSLEQEARRLRRERLGFASDRARPDESGPVLPELSGKQGPEDADGEPEWVGLVLWSRSRLHGRLHFC